MSALHKLSALLKAMAEEEDKGHPPDPFELRVIAKRLEAQAEIYEGSLHE